MANPEHLEILKKDVRIWNHLRKTNPDIKFDLREARLYGVDLRGADLNEVTLIGANLSGSLLCEANLCRAELNGANLQRANLRGADLNGIVLNGANLRRADLSGAYLNKANLCRADLDEANLQRTDLKGADLSGATLIGADLSGADIRRADLSGADLSGANLNEAYLNGADLSGVHLNVANLQRADLRGVNLGGAILNGTILSGANINKAILVETVLGNINLKEVKNLESCNHHGPSIISHRTLTMSGELPIEFLRGCGLPNTLIENYPSILLDKSIQFYSCFISYSHKDEEFAKKILNDLQDQDVRCWFVPKDLNFSDKIKSRIDEATRLHNKLLIILSENSIESDWMENEVEIALEKETKPPKIPVLFPIRIDDAVIKTDKAWVATICRTRYIWDFTNWKDPDFYKKSFERLIQDLKA
jgi:uncharacterized protein YjbI with pentapeptide repeats